MIKRKLYKLTAAVAMTALLAGGIGMPAGMGVYDLIGIEQTVRAASVSKSPVYRLYNPNAGDHHYTMSEQEKNDLVGVGWILEGIAWYGVK